MQKLIHNFLPMENEGEILKNTLKGAGIEINAVADKLKMTRQNLGHHFRNEPLNKKFRDKLFLAYPDIFTNVKHGENKAENGKNFTSNSFSGNDVKYLKTEPQNKPKPNPRIEASPLHRGSDPNDWDYDGTKFEDLGDGIIRMRVHIIPDKAQSGYLRGFKDPEYYDDFKLTSIDVYKEHAGHYLIFELTGDSMMTTDPALFDLMALPGWKALGREVPKHHWKFKLHTHKTDAWIIVHNTEGILHKNITKHNVESGVITIHSLNPKYQDEDLALNDIAQIFSVVKYIIDK